MHCSCACITKVCAHAVEDVQPKEGFREKPYVKAAVAGGTLESIKLLESHGDQVLSAPMNPTAFMLLMHQPVMPLLAHQVLELPPGAELLAESATASNEIWTYQDRALAIQGHPEMPVSEAQTKIHPFLVKNG